jgi:iron complex outermembrane receptor protein
MADPAVMKFRPLLSLLLATPAWAQSTDLLPKRLDELVVTASPLDRTLFELVQPAAVLKEKELMLNLAPTLGETLGKQAGVSSTSFGPGASRPIIRGLGDDRLRVLQNGTSVLDVSNVSPDHAVAADPLTVRSVEIVRGPATLLYGPNTVGGVVNVIDDRIPEERVSGIDGSLDTRYGSAENLRSLSGAVNFGAGPFAFHLDAFTRESDDLEIPGYARSERLRAQDPQPDEARGTLPNSFTESDGAAIGGSYIWDQGFVGVSYSGIDSLYGTVAEEDVTIDLRQRRWDLRGAFYEPANGIKEINYKFGYSDYEHTEFEGAETGTRFLIDGFNTRAEVLHEKLHGFEGAVGVELQRSDFSAVGEEAFLPPVENQVSSLFAFEEIELDRFTLQFGGRYDYQANETDALDRDFNAFSVSAGVIYNPTEDYAVAMTTGYSQRPPNYVELFADGQHVATGTYEIGDPDLGTEDSLSLDLSLRKKTGRVTGSISGFYYRFNDFIANQPTGINDPVDGLPVYNYEAIGATFYGGELEATVHLLEPVKDPAEVKSQQLDLVFLADYVHAEDRDSGESVPRIPPFRSTVALDYQIDRVGARLEAQWCAHQGNTAENEPPSDSYVLLSAGIDYTFTTGDVTTTLFVKGVNLLNEEARPSTSYLKEIAPLAARGVVVGLRADF